jgi:hypothetical protein
MMLFYFPVYEDSKAKAGEEKNYHRDQSLLLVFKHGFMSSCCQYSWIRFGMIIITTCEFGWVFRGTRFNVRNLIAKAAWYHGLAWGSLIVSRICRIVQNPHSGAARSDVGHRVTHVLGIDCCC